MAANVGMRKAFQDVLELADGELVIPKYFASMGAIGAVLVTQESKQPKRAGTLNLTALKEYLLHHQEKEVPLQPLCLSSNHLATASSLSSPISGEIKQSEKIEAYLGLDVGSISTNLVVIDQNKRVLSKRYLMTAGRPIEAVRIGLREIGEEIGDRVEKIGRAHV